MLNFDLLTRDQLWWDQLPRDLLLQDHENNFYEIICLFIDHRRVIFIFFIFCVLKFSRLVSTMKSFLQRNFQIYRIVHFLTTYVSDIGL